MAKCQRIPIVWTCEDRGLAARAEPLGVLGSPTEVRANDMRQLYVRPAGKVIADLSSSSQIANGVGRR